MKTYSGWDAALSLKNELSTPSAYPFHDPEALEAQIQAELEELLEQVEAEERKAQESLIFSPELTNPSVGCLAQRYADRAKLASEFETEIYSDIHSYDLPRMRIQTAAVIDFMKLELSPQKETHRSLIKKYLTEKTGTRHYIEESEVEIAEVGTKYVITVHDVKSAAQLYKLIEHLGHFGVNRQLINVVEVELSLDFYNAPRKELLIALFKSLKLSEDANNIRVYRRKGEKRDMPFNLNRTQQYLKNGYCIGINPKGSDVYYRLYHKVVNKMLPLPPEEHRLRLEVNLHRHELEKITPNLTDFEAIIREGFKHIDFTKLDEDVDESLKQEYRRHVRPYGQEVMPFRSKSGNRRTLPEGIKLNAEVNKIKRTAVSNLLRNFRKN